MSLDSFTGTLLTGYKSDYTSFTFDLFFFLKVEATRVWRY